MSRRVQSSEPADYDRDPQAADPLERLFARMRKDKASTRNGIPKYILLYNHVLEAIENGDWKAGDRLPSETEISEKVSLSIGTVQKALRKLSDDRVIQRLHGHGTFVAGIPAAQDEIRNHRFLDDDGVSLLPIYTTILELSAVTAPGPWADFLAEEQRFVKIARIVSVNLEFKCYGELYLPHSRFAAMLTYSARSLDGIPVTHLMASRFNAPTLHFDHHIRIEALPGPACTAIEVAAGTVGMHWEMFGYSYRDAPISYQRVCVPPNARRLQIRGEDG
jgi:GntR family transcriptional regulator